MRPLWLGSAVLQAAELLLRPRGKAAGPAQGCCIREVGTPAHPKSHGYTPGAPGPQNLGSPKDAGFPQTKSSCTNPSP